MTPSSAFVACEAQAAQWSPSRGNVFLIIPRPNLQYMIHRRTCLSLFRGALLPCVENTPVRERFIPQALSHPYFPFLSIPVSVLLPLSFVPLLLHLSLRLGLRPFTHLSVAPNLYAPLPPTPDTTLARVYNYGKERGRGGRECALPSVGGVIGRFLPSRNVLCVSRAERAKTLLPRAQVRSR